MATEKQKAARKKKNPTNKQGYSGVVLHHKNVYCNRPSPYPLAIAEDNKSITCMVCKKALSNK